MTFRMNEKWISLLLSGILSCWSTATLSWGVYIPLENVADLGVDYAGGAAIAEDASTNYDNPAGLIRLQNPQLIFGGTYVSSRVKFVGTMTNPGFFSPITQSGTVVTIPRGPIPLFHYAQPITSKIAVGISFVVPYGLGLDYSDYSLPRYDVIQARQQSVQIAPGISYALTPMFSIGLGLDILNYAVYQKAAVRTQLLTPIDSSFNVHGGSWNLGWRAGLLYQFNECTRVGFAFHSQIITHNKGTSHFNLNTVPERIFSSNSTVVIPLAPLAVLSAYHQLNPQTALMATVKWLGWSLWRFDRALSIAGPMGPRDVVAPRHLRDGWLFAVGGNYRLTDQWLVRAGLSYIRGSTTDSQRDIFITDPSALNYGIGAHYQPTRCLGFDLAMGGSFFKNVHIDHTTVQINNRLVGTSKQFNGIIPGFGTVGGQVVWNFL